MTIFDDQKYSLQYDIPELCYENLVLVDNGVHTYMDTYTKKIYITHYFNGRWRWIPPMPT